MFSNQIPQRLKKNPPSFSSSFSFRNKQKPFRRRQTRSLPCRQTCHWLPWRWRWRRSKQETVSSVAWTWTGTRVSVPSEDICDIGPLDMNSCIFDPCMAENSELIDPFWKITANHMKLKKKKDFSTICVKMVAPTVTLVCFLSEPKKWHMLLHSHFHSILTIFYFNET